jgi:hypothetical protein
VDTVDGNRSGDARDWYIVGPDERLRARARTPAGFDPEQIAASFLLGKGIDSDGNPRIEMYRLFK